MDGELKGWFIACIVLAYLIGLRVVARRYFARRHGVSLERGETGMMGAVWLGVIWPIAVWLPAVRRPSPCRHHRHVLERERIRRELQTVELLRGQEHV
jgi:hypothetical protein